MGVQLGGQAVIEGVMIRSPRHIICSIRKGKKIVTKRQRYIALGERYPVLKLPIVRGIASFFEMLVIGIRMLNYSAQQAEGHGPRITKRELAFTLAVAIAIAILIFVILPYFLTNLIGIYEHEQAVVFNLVDGLIKLLVFILYILVISQISDIRRIFQYHGAEHKAVHCYEAGRELTVRNARKYSPIHLRCGTSFVIAVILVSIVLFSLIPLMIKAIMPSVFDLNYLIRYAILLPLRILFLMPIVGLSYEVLKLSARLEGNPVMAVLSYPGALTQKLTTREPDSQQLEVALNAVAAALTAEKK